MIVDTHPHPDLPLEGEGENGATMTPSLSPQ